MRAAARLWLIVAAVWCFAGVVWAQETPNYTRWNQEAERVENALAVGVASDAALEAMRGDVVTWRETFLTLKDSGSDRIETINRRLEAMPEAPAEGETEPETLSAARTQLETQLAQLQEPAIRAQLAFAHADGLVREIDEALRNRQATALIRRLATPLNPLNWSGPLNEFTRVATAVPKELVELFGSDTERDAVLRNLPGALIIGMFGVLLLNRAGVWSNGVINAAQSLSRPATALVAESIGVLLQLAMPLVGLFLLLSAVSMSGLLGQTGTILFRSLSSAAVLAILGYWLVARVYPRDRHAETSNNQVLPARLGPMARRNSILLVTVLALHAGIVDLTGELQLSDLTSGYLAGALIFPCTAAIYRLGRMYRLKNIAPKSDDDTAEGPPFMLTVISGLARLARMAAMAGPFVVLAGFVNLAEAVIIPIGFTFLLLAALGRTQGLVARMFSIIRHGTDNASDEITPILINGVMSLAAVPLLALIWGARVADLREIWTSLREGLTLGGVHISPGAALLFVLVFGFGYLLTRFIQGLLSQTVLPRTKLDIGAQRAMTSGAGYIGIFLAGLVAITATGLDLSSIAIVAGALSVGIGFGLQTIVSNFVSGIILLIERPVSEGDWIEVAGQMGIVKRISVRATRIETFDRTDVIIPNADLVSGQVTNWTRGNLIGRVIIPVGVAYGSDTRKVERILREIAESHPMVTLSPPPSVFLMAFGASSVDFEIRAILRDINFMLGVKSEMNHEIVRRFAEEGIEIPFPQTDLWLRNPEALSQGVRPTSDAASPQSPPPPHPLASSRDMLSAEDMDHDGDGGGGGVR